MKYYQFFFLLSSFLLIYQGFGQEKKSINESKLANELFIAKEVELQYNKDKNKFIRPAVKVGNNDPYQFKITKINTALINASLTVESKELVSQRPEVLKPYIDILESFSKEKHTDSETNTAQLTEYDKVYQTARNAISELDRLKRISTKFYEDLKKIKLENIDSTKKMAFEVITNLLDNELTNYKSIEVSSIGIGKTKSDENNANSFTTEDANQENLENNTTKRLAEYKKSILERIELIEAVEKMLEHELFGKINSDFESALRNKILENYALIKSQSQNIDSKKYLGYVNFIENAANAKNYKTIDSRYFSRDDLLEAKIVLRNTFTNDTILNQTLDVYSKGDGSLRLRFSSGFFYNDIVENAYYLEGRGDNEPKGVIKEGKQNFDVAIGAQTHLTIKASSIFDFGINLGAAVSPLDGKTRFLLGGGLLIGKRRELSLSAGAAVARIKVLSDAVEKGNNGLTVPFETEAVPLVDRNKWGMFIGITYNFSNKKK